MAVKLKDKTFKFLTISEDGTPTSYKELLRFNLSKVPAQQFTVEELGKMIRAQDAIDSLVFEDADFEVVKTVIKGARWGNPGGLMKLEAMREIKEFVDYILSF